MTTKEIIQENARLEAEYSAFCPKVFEHIKEMVRRMLEGRDTDTLDFSEWNLSTGGCDDSSILVYGKHGPQGDGPAVGFKKSVRNRRETISVTVGAEYGDCTVPLDSLDLPELMGIIAVLDNLETDLNADKPEWKIDEDGKVISIT